MMRALLLLISAASALSFPVAAGQPASTLEKVYAQLKGTPAERAEGIAYVLDHPREIPTIGLFVAAGSAYDLGRVEDAGLLFYAAQLRAQFDLVRFPPVEEGSNSPAVAIGAVRHQLGEAINPAVMGDPNILNPVVERLAAFPVTTVEGYDPGWEYASEKTGDEAEALASELHSEAVDYWTGIATLMNTPEYLDAFKVIQSYNFASPEQRQDPAFAEKRAAAEKQARAIEEREQIEGVFFRKNK